MPSDNIHYLGLLTILLHIGYFTGCDWTIEDWDCCSNSSQCGINEGDCDSDIDCIGSLACGSHNCFLNDFLSTVDCCYNPNPSEKLVIFKIDAQGT